MKTNRDPYIKQFSTNLWHVYFVNFMGQWTTTTRGTEYGALELAAAIRKRQAGR